MRTHTRFASSTDAVWVGAGILVAVLGLMWVVELVDSVALDDMLQRQGILPRTLNGLDGVIWAPFLHGSFGHLLSNSVPYLVLGGLVMLGGVRRWAIVTAVIVVVGGLATWLFARSAVHIGASILIFGYMGYLLALGFARRSLRDIAIGAVVLVLYGGTLLFGVLPINSGVSWEGHLFGAAAGVLAAIAVAAAERDSAVTG